MYNGFNSDDFVNRIQKNMKTAFDIGAKMQRSIDNAFASIEKNLSELGNFEFKFDFEKIGNNIDKGMYENGWAVLSFQPLGLVMKIMAYESEEIEKTELLPKLNESFEISNHKLESDLKTILSDGDAKFINKQFTLMRLNYRVNSVPSIVMLIEKMIIKITGHEGKFISTGKVPKILEQYIDSLAIDNEENKDTAKEIYVEGFKNNIKIINKTFINYSNNKEAVQEMNILNRNQIFHGLIDFDSIDEIHYYKLYFILIFLTEVYDYQQVN